MGLFLSQRWNRPPSVPSGIDWRNRVSQGLVWVCAPQVNLNAEIISGKSFAIYSGGFGYPIQGILGPSGYRFDAYFGTDILFPIGDSAFSMAMLTEQVSSSPVSGSVKATSTFFGGAVRFYVYYNSGNGYSLLCNSYNSAASATAAGYGSNTQCGSLYAIPESQNLGRKLFSFSTPLAGAFPVVFNGSKNFSTNYVGTNGKAFTGELNNTYNSQVQAGNSEPWTLMTLVWNRRIGDSDRLAMAENPWQIFRPIRPVFISLGQSFQFSRPSADLLTGWTRTPAGGTHSSVINEVTSNQTDYLEASTGSLIDSFTMDQLQQPATGGLDINLDIDASARPVTVDLLNGATVVKTASVSTTGQTTITATAAELSGVSWPWTPTVRITSQ
jgi:hypothetical protein